MKRQEQAGLSLSWYFDWSNPLIIGFIVLIGPIIVTLILAALGGPHV